MIFDFSTIISTVFMYFCQAKANVTMLILLKGGERKCGRGKNAKRKACQLPPVPEHKVMIYSLILSDINERFVSQNRIKGLPGL